MGKGVPCRLWEQLPPRLSVATSARTFLLIGCSDLGFKKRISAKGFFFSPLSYSVVTVLAVEGLVCGSSKAEEHQSLYRQG